MINHGCGCRILSHGSGPVAGWFLRRHWVPGHSKPRATATASKEWVQNLQLALRLLLVCHMLSQSTSFIIHHHWLVYFMESPIYRRFLGLPLEIPSSFIIEAPEIPGVSSPSSPRVPRHQGALRPRRPGAGHQHGRALVLRLSSGSWRRRCHEWQLVFEMGIHIGEIMMYHMCIISYSFYIYIYIYILYISVIYIYTIVVAHQAFSGDVIRTSWGSRLGTSCGSRLGDRGHMTSKMKRKLNEVHPP